jgi:hypothetical protein
LSALALAASPSQIAMTSRFEALIRPRRQAGGGADPFIFGTFECQWAL